MESRINRRNCTENFVTGRHLNLDKLKREAEIFGLENEYLFKQNIPNYPRPEFHGSHLQHDTNKEGLQGIRNDEGFRKPHEGSLVWWTLKVGPEEVRAAEKRLLDRTFPDRAEEQESFLWKFTTSPVFLETSRLGSYRFTFPLSEVLQAYREQVCSGSQPIMRIYKTVLYKQEVMHAVLVHSPANENLYANYPLLTDDPNAVCVFKDERFIWRPEAICETHRFELKYAQSQMKARELSGNDVQFYVWDHVAIALHMEEEQVLKFDVRKLRENLTFSDKGKGAPRSTEFDSFQDAEDLVNDLWPEENIPLKKSQPLRESFTAENFLQK